MSSKGKGKGKAKGKKEKKSKASVPQDEYDEMNADQLTDIGKKLAEKLAEIRRNRNYYQLERDQVQQFYDIVNDEVGKTESHIRNIESQMERMQDTHRNDIKIYLQKVIHLEYEHRNNLEAIEEKSRQEKQQELTNYLHEKADLKHVKSTLQNELRKEELSHEEEIRRLKETERKEMQKLREQFERSHQDMVSNYEQRLQTLKDDLELRQKMEIHEIEERKNRHINDLMIHHEKNFNEMRNYYNSITQDNLDLIKELNHEIEDLKMAHMQNEKAMKAIEKKNASLNEPLIQAENRVKALRHKLQNYAKDKLSLQHAKARLHNMQDSFKKRREEYHKLKIAYQEMENERDRLYRTFEETVLSVDRASSSRNLELSRHLESLLEQFEVKKAQFSSVLRASSLDPLVLTHVTKKLDDVLSAKNEHMEEITYQIAKMTKAHNDVVRVYQAKLAKLGIPEDQLDLEEIIPYTGHSQNQQQYQLARTLQQQQQQVSLNSHGGVHTASPASLQHGHHTHSITGNKKNTHSLIGTAPADLIVQ